MKLIMAIINDEDADDLMDSLADAGFGATKLASTGGFLRSGNTTLICGVTDDNIEKVVGIIEQQCSARRQFSSPGNDAGMNEGFPSFPIEVTVGGATIFVLNVAEFRKI